MARIIDDNKIARIKDATINMVVTNGYGGASISKIAKNAGVAEGYLYRYYSSKTELVNDLLYTNVNELADNMEYLLDNCNTVWEIFELMIKRLIIIAQNQPEKIKFLYVLMHDYNFNLIENQRERIYKLCVRIKETGIKKLELRTDITEEEIYLMGVSFPIQFINLRLKNFFKQSQLSDKEAEQILKICINSLKQ
jgi:AcrR family transcriptional regulator